MIIDIFNNLKWNEVLFAAGLAGIMAFGIIIAILILLLVTLRKVKGIEKEIYSIEKQVGDYIKELTDSENEQLEIEEQDHQSMIISSVLNEIFPQ